MYVPGVLIVFLIAVSIWFQCARSTDDVMYGINTLLFVMCLVIDLMVPGIITGVGWFTPVFSSPAVFMPVGGGLVFAFAVDNRRARGSATKSSGSASGRVCSSRVWLLRWC
ncbi:uncharacterized protein LY79DRAFT_543944 [Colletotrichum navitas]|uniref:Uncharacterized protein n=1 Tax=Colletotrichum navitas TaxID=681940 RepID=A0AAD8V8W2_9PEZI|nr:uncharacterized protein LY79DRAFT_543944 [Colletotrichum navitas]KAK1596703.1 hypothetical protein LY79DRAFT_543944 [Colletotrichum navitas]